MEAIAIRFKYASCEFIKSKNRNFPYMGRLDYSNCLEGGLVPDYTITLNRSDLYPLWKTSCIPVGVWIMLCAGLNSIYVEPSSIEALGGDILHRLWKKVVWSLLIELVYMCELPMETTMTLFQVRVLHTHVHICGYKCVALETRSYGRKHCASKQG